MEDFKCCTGNFTCTRENPLHKQMEQIYDDNMCFYELSITGYLGAEDLLWLTELAQGWFLQKIDLSGVTEMETKGLEDLIDDGEGLGHGIPFFQSNCLEEIILPQVDTIDVPMFIECNYLRKVAIPKTLRHLEHAVFQDCPNIEEIYVPSDLKLRTSHHWSETSFPSLSFAGSGKQFISDNEGWPEKLEKDSFFAFDGVLYYYSKNMDDIELYRYPAGDERTEFVIPEGVKEICNEAFYKNQHLKRVVIPSSVWFFNECPFACCHELETIVFKQNNRLIHISYPGYDFEEVINEVFKVTSYDNSDYVYQVGLIDLPNLKHIYLYAENPEGVCFDMFNGLSNLGEVTLHVPCSSKKAYEDFEVEWFGYGGGNRHTEKSYRRFHHIEEFDPLDLQDE